MISVGSKYISRLVCLGASVCFVVAGFGAQENRIRGIVNGSETVALRGNIHPKATVENDRGALDPAVRIQGLRLVLGQTDAQVAALGQLLEEQRDPASADYRNWLSPEEFADRFGLSQSDVQKVESWLRSGGMIVEETARARNWIRFSGTAEQVQAAFHTEFHRYDAQGEKHFANALAVSIPASLEGIVTAVRGFNDFHPKPQRFFTGDTFLTGDRPDFNSSNGTHYLAPADLAVIYNAQPLYDAGYDGTGQKLAIAGQTDINLADLRSFRTQFNLPAKDPQLVLTGPDPGVSSGDKIEATLDLEWSGAVARGATIVYVYSQDVFESLEYAIDQNLAPVVSVSYGGCETASALSLRALAQQANAQGITWMNASGDSGAAGCDDGANVATHSAAVSFPADIPEVTAVGGTELNDVGGSSYWSNRNGSGQGSALSYIPENAWNDTAISSELAAGGGGASSIYAKPWWQTGPGVPNDQARDVPDVSLAASGAHDSYLIYVNGGLMSVGGTSASSPAFAGIATILNQYLVAKGQAKSGLGNMNPFLYALAQNTTGVFHDVTSGDNVVPCGAGVAGCVFGSYGYEAGPGYDLATGLGSVDAYNLVTNWTSFSPAVGTTIVLTASPMSIPQGGATQLTAYVSAVSGSTGPTGIVTFAMGSTTLGSVAVAGSGATVTATLGVQGIALAIGSNTITASYAGSGTFSSSTATATVAVTTAAASSTTITANPLNIAQSGSTVLTVLVTQASGNVAPAGTVTFALGNTPVGTQTLTPSATGASASLIVKGSILAVGPNSIVASYAGSGTVAGSTSLPVIITVTGAPTATKTLVTATPAAISQTMSTVLTATIKPVTGSAGTLGAVVFTAGGISLGTATLSLAGSTATATLSVKGTTLAQGANTITAAWAGNTSSAGSSGTVNVSVSVPPTATSATLVAVPAIVAQNATTVLTATVRAITGNAGPGGVVVFATGITSLGSAPVIVSGMTGTATLTVKGSSLPSGIDRVTATYIPDGNFSGALSTANVIVGSSTVGTTIAAVASPTSIMRSGSTRLAVTVAATSGSTSPTGSVTFLAGNVTLGSVAVSGSGGTSGATFPLKGSSLVAGNNTITVIYVGSGFAAAQTTVTVNVTQTARRL